MGFLSWLDPSRRPRPARGGARPTRLSLEFLEDRCAPAVGVAFLGDSIFYGYEYAAGSPVWDAFIEPLVPKNLAINGYTTEQVLARLNEGALADSDPGAVVLSVGINDLVLGKTPREVAAGVWWVVQTLRAEEPQANVLVQSLLPTRGLGDALNARVDQTNWWLAGLDGDRVRYLPVNRYFRRADGSADPDLLADAVHPNLRGYQVITAALLSALAAFQGPAAPPPGPAGGVPLAGDWDGDGIDGIGTFEPATGIWRLRGEASAGEAEAVFPYGLPGWLPVVGDWDGDGADGIGAFDPGTGRWYLRDQAGPGPADAAFAFGLPGWAPVAGDWDGDGTDSVGVVDPRGVWYLSPGLGTGPLAASFAFGLGSWAPVAGDWDGDGDDEVGVVDPASLMWYLRDSDEEDAEVTRFAHGIAGWRPVVGDWDGTGTAAVVDPEGDWHIRGSDGGPFRF